jgi:MOSC domain-containing protein YiiM
MHRTTAEMESHLDTILAAPKDTGRIEMLVRRPAEGEREVVTVAEMTTEAGLVGDNWIDRLEDDGQPDYTAQITLMNSRVAAALAAKDRWPLAGDQIYVDMDISVANLPPGSRLRVGTAMIEISVAPHTGCAQFAGRFGKEALRFANIGVGRENRFRGVNAFVVEDGEVTLGDTVVKLPR